MIRVARRAGLTPCRTLVHSRVRLPVWVVMGDDALEISIAILNLNSSVQSVFQGGVRRGGGPPEYLS